jgi:hypothetical protein
MDMLRDYETAFYFYHYDHLLPKSDYPDLAEAEWNMVLSCEACNKIKHVYDPGKHAGRDEETLLDLFKQAAGPSELRPTLLGLVKSYIDEQKKQYIAKFPDQQRLLREALDHLPEST